MKAAGTVFVAAAAFALLTVRGTVHIGRHPPSEPAIVVRAEAHAAAAAAPRRRLGVAVRRRVEHVRLDRYQGAGER